MDKQKQIEEMAYLICDMTTKCLDCSKYECKSKDICEKLYNAGYRKIPEGAVVVSKQVWEHIENWDKTRKAVEERVRKEITEGKV